MMGIAMVSWAARLGHLPLEATWLAFLGHPVTPYILTLLALGELGNDKLPKTPSRTVPPAFVARLVTGALCGLAVGLARGQWPVCVAAALAGSVFGTLGGVKARVTAASLFGQDWPAALLEDLVAIGLAASAVFLPQ